MAKPEFWIGTSWKMNKLRKEAQVFASALRAAEQEADPKIQRFVIPAFTVLREVKQSLAGTSVKIGTQNMHWDEQGAWTGGVLPLMLKNCDLDIVELGHSERRTHFGETNHTVGLKSAAAVRHGLTPLINTFDPKGRSAGNVNANNQLDTKYNKA